MDRNSSMATVFHIVTATLPMITVGNLVGFNFLTFSLTHKKLAHEILGTVVV